MLKNSTSFASSSLMTAAAGVSTMIPVSTFPKGIPSAASSLFTSSTISRIFRISFTEMIMGNMTAAVP